jgi:hypothetical protein
VHVGDADTVRTEWHLAGCQSPAESSAHCPEGQRLMETEGQPDGHCVLDGHCGRCEAQRDPRAA